MNKIYLQREEEIDVEVLRDLTLKNEGIWKKLSKSGHPEAMALKGGILGHVIHESISVPLESP